MLKNFSLISALFFIAFILLNNECDNPSNTTTDYDTTYVYDTINDTSSQAAFVYATYFKYDTALQNRTLADVESTNVYGTVFADPVPTLEHIKVGQSTFAGANYYEYLPGYIMFGEYYYGFSIYNDYILIGTDFTPLSIELKTSSGTLNGTISLPDTIQSVTVTIDDTIPVNQPIPISFSCSDADFYRVSFTYQHQDGPASYVSYEIDTFVTNKSVTFPGSKIPKNGNIYGFFVVPVNGPLPQAGANGNMTGEGVGYLYYYYEGESGYLDKTIVVGTGLSRDIKKRNMTEADRRDRKSSLRGRIEEIVLLKDG